MYILRIPRIIDTRCFDSYKREGKSTKEIPLIGTGFHSWIDHMFWFLPFSSVKQAFAVLDSIDELTSGTLNHFIVCIFDIFYLFCIFCIFCVFCICCIFYMTNTKSVSSDDWDVKHEEIAAEHNLPQAQQDLKNSRKAWIKENSPNKCGRAVTDNHPANGLKSIVRK
jgi:hypothetical protein